MNPVLIDTADGIIAGHGRVAAAQTLGHTEVPVIELAHLSEAERRAYVIADNRLAELAGWDRDILAIEFQALSELDLDFDLEITGFETAELDLQWCQTNSNQSQFAAEYMNLCGTKLPPLGQSGASVKLEIVS